MNKLKNGGFWVSIVSAILLILQAIFGWKIDNALVTELSTSVLGILVVFGIIKDHSTAKNSNDTPELKQNEEIIQDDETQNSKTEAEQNSTEE